MDTAIRRGRPRTRLSRIRILFLALLAAAAGLFTGAAPAHAQTPLFCFVYQDNPTPVVPWTPSSTYNSCGAMVIGYDTTTNEYTVELPGAASPNAVAHVTAVTERGDPSWCQLDWLGLGPVGTNTFVEVNCFRPGGLSTPDRFSLTYEGGVAAALPPNGAYAYVWDEFGTIEAALDSSGPVPTVMPLPGVGKYEVTFTAPVASQTAGGLQVTAVSGSPARCKPVSLQTTTTMPTFEVDCVNSTGNPTASGFTATYQSQVDLTGRPATTDKRFGYVMDGGGLLTNFNSMTGFNGNSVTDNAAPPSSSIKWPLVALIPANGQITAFGPNPDYCHFSSIPMLPWQPVMTTEFMPRIECFDAASKQITDQYFASYISVEL